MSKFLCPLKRITFITFTNQSSFISVNSQCHRVLLTRNITKFRGTGGGTLNQKRTKITSLGWFLLLIPVTTFSLGVWQVQRKKWKEGLIEALNREVNSTPIELPDDLSDLLLMEYRPIRVRGQFLHDKEIYMGPRSYIEDGDATSTSGLFSQGNKGIGYLVITPFQLQDRK